MRELHDILSKGDIIKKEILDYTSYQVTETIPLKVINVSTGENLEWKGHYIKLRNIHGWEELEEHLKSEGIPNRDISNLLAAFNDIINENT